MENKLIEFEGKTYLVLDVDETADVASLALWYWTKRAYLIREFRGDLKPDRWISTKRLSECKQIGAE